MSRIYSAVVPLVFGGPSAASPVCDLESSAVESPTIIAIDFNTAFPSIGQVGRIGFGRAANTPVATLKQLFSSENPSDPASTSALGMAWSTAPTAPTNFNRMISFTNNIGEYAIFTFPAGIKLMPSTSFVAWSFDTNQRAFWVNMGWEIGL